MYHFRETSIISSVTEQKDMERLMKVKKSGLIVSGCREMEIKSDYWLSERFKIKERHWLHEEEEKDVQ